MGVVYVCAGIGKVISFLSQRTGVIVREVTTVLQYYYPSCPIVPRTRGNHACVRTVISDSSRSSSLLILLPVVRFLKTESQKVIKQYYHYSIILPV